VYRYTSCVCCLQSFLVSEHAQPMSLAETRVTRAFGRQGDNEFLFQYEVEKKSGEMTAPAGLPLYLEFAHLMGLPRLIANHVRARQGDPGWTDDQIIMALVLLIITFFCLLGSELQKIFSFFRDAIGVPSIQKGTVS
jgi:hypothetical protein